MNNSNPFDEMFGSGGNPFDSFSKASKSYCGNCFVKQELKNGKVKTEMGKCSKCGAEGIVFTVK